MGYIVSIYGPFPASVHNLTIFRKGLMKKLRFLIERVEADDGYKGESDFVDIPKVGCIHNHAIELGLKNTNNCPGCIQHKLKARLRSRQETCNRRFKQFRILSERYRHDLKLHGHIFKAIAVITQMDIRNGNNLYYCKQYKTMQSDQRRIDDRRLLLALKQRNARCTQRR